MSLNFNAQKQLQINDSFSNLDIRSNFGFYHDIDNSETINSIQHKKLSHYNNQNFPGLFGSKFWFKLDLHNLSQTSLDLIFDIKAYAFFKKLNLYKVEQESIERIYTQTEFLKRSFEIPTEISKTSSATYFFEVRFSKAVFFPIQLFTQKNYRTETTKNIILLGLYYGFSILVLVINLLFFFFTRNKFFLYYALLQAAIISSIAYLDGFYYYAFGDSLFTRLVNILINNLTLALAGMLFVYYAFDLKKIFPKFKIIGIVLFSFCAFCFIMFAFTKDSFWTGIGKACYLVTLLGSFIIGVVLFRKDIYARFYVGAYTILLTCHILFLLPVLYGFKDLGFTEWHYKLGSALEMIIFLIAIPYRHKLLEKEKEEIQEDLSSYRKRLSDQKEMHSLEENLTDTKIKTNLFTKKYDLSVREVEVLEGILKGHSNKEIAQKLHITTETVKYHCSNLYKKTDIKNRSQLTALYNTIVFFNEK